jgi:hypothetical protein
MFNRNLDNTINEKILLSFGRYTTGENIFTAGTFTTGFVRTRCDYIYCWFKGRPSATLKEDVLSGLLSRPSRSIFICCVDVSRKTTPSILKIKVVLALVTIFWT